METFEFKEKNKNAITLSAVSSPNQSLHRVTKKQIKILGEMIEEEIKKQHKPLSGVSIAFYGSLKVPQKELKRYATALGAHVTTAATKKDTPEFILSNETGFHKFHKTKILDDDQQMVSLRFFYALALGEDADRDFSPFFFNENNTTPEEVKKRLVLCKCKIDPLWDGRKGAPGFIVGLEKYLPEFAGSEEAAKVLLRE